MTTFTRLTLILFVLASAAISSSAQTSLWGTAEFGGVAGLGDIFKTDGSGLNPQEMYAFGDTSDGGYPDGGLLLASNGKLYGLTSEGGVYSNGVLFEFDPETNIFTKKADFDGTNTGAGPTGTLMQASNGKLYGMNGTGGANNLGVLFEYNIAADSLIKLVDCDGPNTGAIPFSNSLIQASNGKLYGMTPAGGVDSTGIIFEYDIATGIFRKKADFPLYSSSGESSLGTLLEVSDSIFYGLSSQGGTSGAGYVFEFNLRDSSITDKIDFESLTTGGFPNGSLMKATNGKLYGLTSSGGSDGSGTMFEYDMASNSFTNILDFGVLDTGSTGALYTYDPFGTPLQASNGKIYAVSAYGGTFGGSGNGSLFEYDPADSMYAVTVDLAASIKAGEPMNEQLVEVHSPLGIASPGDANNSLSVFPNPASDQLVVKTTYGIILHAELFDANGRIVYTAAPGNNQMNIPVGQLAVGLYIVSVVTDEKVLHKKILVIHN